VRVETDQTISLYGNGDCVPRVFVNYAFDSPITFVGGYASLALQSGWNRIDITGYNQNEGYGFTCGALASLVDTMNSTENQAPIADADGPYVADEGFPVNFNGSGSSDPDGDPLQYRWDFEDDGIWDTPWSTDPMAQHTYGDNWIGQARLEVSNGVMTDTDPAPVTINNVAPNAWINFVDQPNPNFILPHHVLTFGGGFADWGWLDTHAALWDFDDGATAPGIVVEDNNPPQAEGDALVQHAYLQTGMYSVTLTITDDDGGNVVSAPWIVTVLAPGQAVQTLDEYIQGLEDSAFKNNATQRKRALHNSLEALIGLINAGEFQQATDKLLNDIRAKADGSLGGNPKNDWITDPTAQQTICALIDDIIADLQLL
jgi:PKD repeat protein